MKKINFMSIAMFTVSILVSCNNDDSYLTQNGRQQLSEEEVENAVLRLGFISGSERLKGEIDSRRKVNFRGEPSFRPEIGIKVRIAKKKYDCLKGFGLCDFKPIEVPKLQMKMIKKMKIEEKTDENVYVSYLEKDERGNEYMDLLIAKDPLSEGLVNMPAFTVEEDLEKDVPHNKNTHLIMVPGNYKYDRSLGKYGGYRIKLIQINI